jgi:hypothetical protein
MEQNMHTMDFVEKHTDIHGEFNGNVYHQKRDGEVEKYPYEPVSYYQRTALVIRGEWIRRYATRVSNPQKSGYAEIVRKLYNNTPFKFPGGEQKFAADTGFYVREKGFYELRWQGMPAGIIQKLSPRSEVKLNFDAEGEFLLKVYLDNELYCERSFIIAGGDLDAMYDNWLAENYLEILGFAEPEYASLKTYRRGLRSRRNWIIALEGKCIKEVLFTRKDLKYKDDKMQRPWIYHRRAYDHADNSQTEYFCEKMREIGSNWQQLSEQEKENWDEKSENLWQKKGRQLNNPRITGFNLYAREYLCEHG